MEVFLAIGGQWDKPRSSIRCRAEYVEIQGPSTCMKKRTEVMEGNGNKIQRNLG